MARWAVNISLEKIMRLADFLLEDAESILIGWEDFARSLFPATANLDSEALRDHAYQMLQAISEDLRLPQTKEAQFEKSLGMGCRPGSAPATAAQTHAVLRARGGFDIIQLTAEFRALRASVLRKWMDRFSDETYFVDDVIRFNEAIDQALAESVAFFSLQTDQSRNLFLGMLGHDMRSPLQSIQMTATHLAALNAGEKVSNAASRLVRSGARMQALLDDLLDFNRTRFGLGINVVLSEVDLATCFADELDSIRAAHPERTIDFHVVGDLRGRWDGRRLQQVLGNLVLNALKYGTPNSPVQVEIVGSQNQVRFEVKNQGIAIGDLALRKIFDPLERGAQPEVPGDADGNLGLGLYISRQIAIAHGGDIEVKSDMAETIFSVHLPRTQA
jgi:signal transduction histidine kinase